VQVNTHRASECLRVSLLTRHRIHRLLPFHSLANLVPSRKRSNSSVARVLS
jgi:hypothetical protein